MSLPAQARLWLHALLLAPALAFPALAVSQGDGEVNPADIVQVRILSDQAHAVAGTTLTVGVEYKISRDWHIYWSNPGDTGMPTQVSFSINGSPAPKVRAQYPIPDSFLSPGDLLSFGYSDRVILLADIPVPADAEGDYVVSAQTRYLMCADRCIPGSAKVSLTLPVGIKPKESPQLSLIAEVRKTLPAASLPPGVEVKLGASGTSLEARWPASAGKILGLSSPKGKGGFMLYPDRVPGVNWRTVNVTDLQGGKLGVVADQGARAQVDFSIGDPEKDTGEPIRAVLAWSVIGADGKPGPVQGSTVIIPRR